MSRCSRAWQNHADFMQGPFSADSLSGIAQLTMPSILVRIPLVVVVAIAWAAAGASVAYAAITLGAWFSGWALPSTAALLQIRAVATVATWEPHFAEVLLFLGAIGGVSSWLAKQLGIDQTDHERRLKRLLCIVGLPVIFAAFMLSASAQWSGLLRQGDYSYTAIVGLVPFSDASSYFGEAYDALKDGAFGVHGSRRPLAQIVRTSLLVMSGYSYAGMIALQCLALSAALFFASRSVARWLGPWAGLAFAAMAYSVCREFSVTALTESLGLIWALTAIPFLVEAIRSRSLPHSALGLFLFTIAMLTRMGSAFTVPALAVWIIWSLGVRCGRTLRATGLTALALAAAITFHFAASKIYSTDTALTGSNFSYAMCSISIGGNWTDCMSRYESEMPKDELGRTSFLYRKAFENIATQPRIALHRMASGAAQFARDLPSAIIKGYQAVTPLSGWTLLFAAAVFGIGLARTAPRLPRSEWVFWIVFWTSALASAALIYFDDGRRTMVAIYPLVALFAVRGLQFSSPEPRTDGAISIGPGWVLSTAALLLFLAIPWSAQKLSPVGASLDQADSAEYIFGGRRITGVLVVSDGEPLRPDVPTIHLSDFENVVRASGIEDVQGLVTPRPPATPFGFIASPNFLKHRWTRHLFIVPPKVLLERDAVAWRLQVEALYVKPEHGPHWFSVTGAERTDAETIARNSSRSQN
jgi:hypothetical protein